MTSNKMHTVLLYTAVARVRQYLCDPLVDRKPHMSVCLIFLSISLQTVLRHEKSLLVMTHIYSPKPNVETEEVEYFIIK